MKRRLLFTFATLLALLPYVGLAATTTWSFEWNTSKTKGGQGFYNFGSSKVEKDVYTTERLSGNLVGISINLCKSIQKELFINDTP